MNQVNHGLHLLVAEHYRPQHDILVQFFGFRFNHQHRLLRAGHHQIQFGGLQLGLGRVEHIAALHKTHARRGDGALERHAGQSQCGRGADHRRNIRVDFRIARHHCRDDLHFVVKTIRKQRAYRAVDQAAGENFFLRRAAFATEEATGYLA